MKIGKRTMPFDHAMIGTTFSLDEKPFTYTYLGRKNYGNYVYNNHLFLVIHENANSYINHHSTGWPESLLSIGYLKPRLNEMKRIQQDLIMKVQSKKDLLQLKKIQQTIQLPYDIYVVMSAFLGEAKWYSL